MHRYRVYSNQGEVVTRCGAPCLCGFPAAVLQLLIQRAVLIKPLTGKVQASAWRFQALGVASPVLAALHGSSALHGSFSFSPSDDLPI